MLQEPRDIYGVETARMAGAAFCHNAGMQFCFLSYQPQDNKERMLFRKVFARKKTKDWKRFIQKIKSPLRQTPKQIKHSPWLAASRDMGFLHSLWLGPASSIMAF